MPRCDRHEGDDGLHAADHGARPCRQPFGVLLSQLGLWGARGWFVNALPAKMSYVISFSAAWQGVVLGLLIAMLFSALPLLQIRTIKPKLLLRDENNVSL